MDPKTRFGAFELGPPIGEGGMSEVFEGRHVTSGEAVAIKVTRSQNDAFRLAFASEIAAMARMHHPSIVRIHDWAALPDGSGSWCAMDWAPYGSLDASHILDWYDLREMLIQVLQALAHAHARDVIHRDLKPQNILVFDSQNGARYRLADFGLAHSRLHHEAQQTGVVAGTPSYMAPEQLHGQWREFGPWTDLYALGCMAFELASGRPPFTGSSPMAVAIAHVREPRPELVARFDVPDGFSEWTRRLLCRDWTRRPQNANAARYALEQLPDPILSDSAKMVAFEAAPTFEFNPTLLAKTLVEHGFSPSIVGDQDDIGGYFPAIPIPGEWRTSDIDSTAQFDDAGSRLLGLRETALVGHEELRDTLWAELRRVVTERSPRVVLLEGEVHEATRIVDWFVKRLRELTTLPAVIFDASLEQLDRDPFFDTLRLMLGTSNLGDDRLPEHIERTIRHHVGDHPTLCRDVLEVFASTTPSVVRRLAARATFWELVTAIANRQPLLLVINEIARDPIEWLLIERIIYTSSAPILVVATPVAPTWQPCESERRIRQDEQTVLLEPQRLTFEQATYVLDSYIRLVPTLRQAWGEFATRDLSLAIDVVIDGASMGAIEPTESGYRLIAGLEMPTTVQAAADMRMAALSRRHTTAKRALTVAALLGRYVESKPWRRAMKQLGVTLETSAVEVLIRYRLLRRVRDGYRFSSESDRLAVLTHLTRDDAHVLLKTLPTDGVHWDLARAMVHLRLGEPEHAAQTLLGIELEMLRDSNTQADRWLNISHTIVDQLPPGHDLSNWTRVVSVRCLRGKNPQLRIAFVTKNLGELPDTADRNVVWELQSEKSIALCHLGRLEEAATIADALIEEPELGDRLRAEALATRGWVELNIGTLDKAFVMLNEAVDRHVALGHYGPAAVAAQYAALAVKDFDTVDAQFDRALRYASLAHDVTKYVPVLLERSMDHLYNERVEQIDRDSKIAYRLGSWGTPLMRVAFGANRAICLASLGKAKRAERVLRDTETIWHPDDHTGRTQLDGTRAVLAAIVGDTKRWDELMAHPLAPPIPNILQLLSVRHWERHGDERRAEEARSHFTD